VASRYSRKVNALRRAEEQLRQGGFEESSVQKYYRDPCYRVVASEILRSAKKANRSKP
jgi:hypothetical protein